MKAGHASGAITERYIHAAQVLFPGAAEKGEDRMFGDVYARTQDGDVARVHKWSGRKLVES